MKTILAPIDFSTITSAVADEAVNLARAVSGRVVLLTVIQPPVVMSEYAALMDVAEITSAGAKHAGQQLEQLARRLEGAGVSVECVQVVGAPIAHILEQAQQRAADYIVM